MWRVAGIARATGTRLRVIDLACGCAVKSLVLAQDDASVLVTCVDVPRVLEVARDLARRMGVLGQVVFVPRDELGLQPTLDPQSHEAALIGQLTYYLTPEQNVVLFQEIARALVPGGTLVVDAIMTGDEPSVWASTVTLLALGTASGGKAYAFDEYQSWLVTAGFRQVRRLGQHWVAAST
jgi:O-methyltransferase involved in polyketide biosynthesis